MVELIGILATAFVLISFLMRGEKHIRLINIFGAVTFVVYGACIGAFSVYFMNALLIFIHAYYLYKLRKENKTSK